MEWIGNERSLFRWHFLELYRPKVSENELKGCFPWAFDCSQSPESSQSPYRTELDPLHYNLWSSKIIKNLLQVEKLRENASRTAFDKLAGFIALHQLRHDQLSLSFLDISVDKLTRIRDNFLLETKCSTGYVLLCELIIQSLEAVKDDKKHITYLKEICLLPKILEHDKEEWIQHQDVANNKLKWLKKVCMSVRGLLQVGKVKRFLERTDLYHVFEDCLKKQEVLLNTLLHNILLLLDNMEYPCRKFMNKFNKTKESMLEGIETAKRLKESIQSAYAKECVIPDIEVEVVKVFCDIEKTQNYLMGKILLFADNAYWVFTVVNITENYQGQIRCQLWNEKAVRLVLWTCGDIELNPGPNSRSEIKRAFSTCIHQDLLRKIWEASGRSPPSLLFSQPPPWWNDLENKTSFAKISDRKSESEEIFEKTVHLFLQKVPKSCFHGILDSYKIVHCNNADKKDIERCTQELKVWVKKRKIEKIINPSEDEDASLLIEVLERCFEDNNTPSPKLTKKLENLVAKAKSVVKRKADTESCLESKHKRQRKNLSSSSTDIKDKSSEVIPCETKEGPRFSSKSTTSECHHSNSNISPPLDADEKTFEQQVQEDNLPGGHEEKTTDSPASEESETLEQVNRDTQSEPDTNLSPPLSEQDFDVDILLEMFLESPFPHPSSTSDQNVDEVFWQEA